MARLVSAFFQVSDQDQLVDLSIGDQMNIFMKKIEHRVRSGGGQLDWFDKHLKAVTFIDVMAESFAIARGYQIYSNEQFRVLLIRFEDPTRVGPGALNRFFNTTSFDEIPQRNSADSKIYSDVYKLFKATARFSPDVLNRVYDSDLARHFYSDDELQGMPTAWQVRC